jgi:hypothetical protein
MSARVKVGRLIIEADVVEIYTKRGEVRRLEEEEEEEEE